MSSELFFDTQRMTEDSVQAEASDNGMTGMDLAYAIYPRVVGVITLICSILMISMAWHRRKYMFHRLILGKASTLVA